MAIATQTGPLGEIQYRTVKLADLITEGRFNRPVSESGVTRILSAFNPQAFGAIILWERGAQLVIIDGQHRVEAARRFGIPEDIKCIPAVIHRGLTLDQAAQLFVQHNDAKLVSAYDKYAALLTAGHAETMAIDSVVRAQDLLVTRGGTDGCISCVDALRKVWQMGEPEGVILARTLRALYKAWGPFSEAYRASILRGVGLYFHEHRETDPDALADALVRGPGAPMNFVGWAKTIAGTQRLPLDRAIAQVIERRVMNRPPRPRKAKEA